MKSFLIFSNSTEILGLSLSASNASAQVLAPISRMDSATAIDYNAGRFDRIRFMVTEFKSEVVIWYFKKSWIILFLA